MLTLNQYSIKYSINIHTLRSWVKRDKIDGAELKNKRWFIPDAPIDNGDAPINNSTNAAALELLIKEKDERIAGLENQIQNLQEQNKNLDDARMRADQLNLNLTIQLKSNSAGLLGMIKRLFLGEPKIKTV